MTTEYVHIPLNQQMQAISGSFTLEKEGVITISGKEVLYAVGMGIMDTSCCGMTGGRYALVPGFTVSLKNRKNQEGFWVSDVEPVTDSNVQQEIRKTILKNEAVSQVNFL